MTSGTTTSQLTATTPDPDLEPGQQVGEYVVEDKIGQGGFGAVFKATHPLIGKVVAIKVLARKFSVDPEMVERFVAEARAVNQIRHRNIIDIFSFGQLGDGRHYYVMEYLEGDPLDAILQRDTRMAVADALPILRAIARALDACHAKGIAHRDLKPANIFIARDPDGDRYPKLLDFGIAKLMGPEETLKQKTRTGIPMGTPYYMSPEQCRGRDVDHRTDYYAFGVVAYELLTGVYPIDGEDYMTILMRQISDTPPLASSHVADLPPGIDDALAWLMEKEPDARPQSLVAAIAALEASAEASGIRIPVSRDSSAVTVPEGRRTPAPGSLRRPLAGADTQLPNVANPAITLPAGRAASTDDQLVEPVPRKGRLPLILGGLALAIVVGVIVVATNRSKPASVAQFDVARPPLVAQPEPPPKPDPVAKVELPAVDVTARDNKPVTIMISGVPDGTNVFLLGKQIGTAPGPVQLDRGTDAIVLMLQCDGYQASSKSITPDKDQPLDVQLAKKRSGPATTKVKQPGKDDLAVPTFK